MTNDTETLARFTANAAITRPELVAAAAAMTPAEFESFLEGYLAEHATEMLAEGVRRGRRALDVMADRLTGAGCYDASEFDRTPRDRFASAVWQGVRAAA